MCKSTVFVILSLLLWPIPSRAGNGVVRGVVTDAHSGDGLPGANVSIRGTALGAATDLEGKYSIRSVPVGRYKVVISFIGYKTMEFDIRVVVDEPAIQDAQLAFEMVESEEVVVTALMEGQVRAINQQLSSNTIVNVVSKDRIEELPDQNAAESLARLPGIAVQRDAGEGQKVVVRGLSPKFNSITINGERIPATDAENRSVDLSMVSTDVLSGIEVFKSLTPDKDGDAVGGTVNFVMKKAQPGLNGNMRFQSGYNDHETELGQYKGSASLGHRLLNGRLGLLGTGSIQRANRSSDLLDAEYIFKREAREGEDRALIEVGKLNLSDRLETRYRLSGSFSADFDLDEGELLLTSLWARTERDELRRRKRYRVDAGRVEYDLRDREINTTLWSNALSGKHDWGALQIDWRSSFSRTTRDIPFSNLARFQERAAFNNSLIDDQGPDLIPAGAKNDIEDTWFQFGTFNPERITDRDLTGQLDLRLPVRLGRNVAGFFKAGGKIRDKNRDRDKEELRTPFAETDRIGRENSDQFDLTREGHIKIGNFIDPVFDAGDFLDGRFEFPLGLSRDRINDFRTTFQDRYDVNRVALLDNYEAGETISSAYLMTQLNLGRRIMLLPGFRFERTTNSYDAKVGELRGDLGAQGAIIDSTGGQEYSEVLPMFHLRYKVTSNFDIRLAATRSLSRPDHFNLVPFENISRSEQTVTRGNSELKHTTVWNYDAYLSFYGRAGLFTVGGFYKELKDIDYIRQTRLTEGELSGFTVTEPVNGEESTVYGIEFDIQTNLSFLPSPLDGIVLNANYSFVDSETFFPFFKIGPRSPDPPFRPTVIDTVRESTLPGQSRHIANLSVGYEKRGFTARVSVLFQEKSLITVGTRDELDGFTDETVRWDIAFSQKFGGGLSTFFNLNNFSDAPEGAFLGISAFPTREEFFGWTGDLGVRYRF